MLKRMTFAILFVLGAGAWGVAQAAPAEPSLAPVATSLRIPVERVQTPTEADLYCAGFVAEKPLPDSNLVIGGLESPNTSKFTNGEIVFLRGGGYRNGEQYAIVRELRDPNRYEAFPGQAKALAAAGSPYAEVGRVRILDAHREVAVAQVEYSCDPVNPGDVAVPFALKAPIPFHPPIAFERFSAAKGVRLARIILAKDFDTVLGTGAKVYLNAGAKQGIKVGDYLRAWRKYSAALSDPVESLALKASTADDTQKNPPTFEPPPSTHARGPVIHLAELPDRAVAELVVLGVSPSTATAMIVFALEDVRVGDGVERDQQP